VYYDLTIIPDDLHETMIHARWVDVWARMGEFMHDYVWDRKTPPPSTASVTRTVR
jgi:dipeptidyl-peptidase-4